MRTEDILNEFLRRLHHDLETSQISTVEQYQELFPGHEELVAREYERILDESDLPGEPTDAETRAILAGLAKRSLSTDRYEVRGEVARGGMGVILEIWDKDLERRLAMKVALERKGSMSKSLARFLAEAKVTGQLDHPGVVPVHELGVDEDGRVYFTMRLVKGRELGEIFELVRSEAEGWTQTRALSVLLRVCETMAYAHAKGVVHRDLKPANIMIGRFGEVYVLDWGLAKVIEGDDRDGATSKAWEDPPSTTHVHVSELSPIVTRAGTILGTPSYMAPERAIGIDENVDPRIDVYAAGAILYELLTGRMPYGQAPSPPEILDELLDGPPRSVHELAPDQPGELLAICERAMARNPADRYSSMTALADDLRAFLEQRVVSAYEQGAVAELRKWIARNRGLANAILAAALLLLLGLATALVLKARADHEKSNVLRLSAFQDLEDLIAEANSEDMWPLHPDRRNVYVDWIERAEGLVAGLEVGEGGGPGHNEVLNELRARVDRHGGGGVLEESQEAWWLAQVEKLVIALEELGGGETGLMGRGVSPEHGWGVGRRLDYVQAVEGRTVSGVDPSGRWREAARLVASDERFRGFELRPQLGLLPLGLDTRSGLLEFADLQTGDVPLRNSTGVLVPREEDGLVFVLIPGGTFHMGTQSEDPDGPNYFRPPDSSPIERNEKPVHEVTLDPFLISKFEMTQGQWLRFVGKNPSFYPPGEGVDERLRSLRHPVEGVSWYEAERQLKRLGFVLPTEAQWERAARAGTTTPWSFGSDERESERTSNVADAYGKKYGPKGLTYEDWSDGHATHAPVGSFLPNAFGLHDVHGNVWEWCRDHFAPTYAVPVAPGDGERQLQGPLGRSARGGAFDFTAGQTRSANRYDVPPERANYNIGLRPVRRLDP